MTKHVYTLSIERDLMAQVQRVALRLGISRSEAIRRAIRAWLALGPGEDAPWQEDQGGES